MASVVVPRVEAPPEPRGPSEVPRACWILLHAAFLILPLASVVSALILIGLGTYFTWRRTRIEVPIPAKSWTLLMAVVALSACTSVAPLFSSLAILLFGGYYTVMWVTGLMLDTPERLWSLCRNIFWTTVGCAALGIGLVFSKTYWVYQSGPIDLRLGTIDHRASSIFYHPNIFSAYLLLVSGIGLMLLIRHQRRQRLAIALGLGTILIAQVLTASRSGWIGTLATLALIGLLVDRRILLTLLGGLTASFLAFWPMILPRLHTLAEADYGSNLHRVMVWKSAIAMIRERPLTGWGPGTWPLVYPRFEDPNILEKMPHAHNLYLMIGAEFGLIVLVVLVGVFVSLVAKTIRETWTTPWRRHVIILGCTILGYLIVGLFDFIFTEGRNSILFFAMLGMLVAMRRFKPQPQRSVPRVLFISNGYGEDRIAAAIARRWDPDRFTLWALPIVGEGRALKAAGLPVVGPTRSMPSGGFILRSPRALWRDLANGLFGLTLRQIAAIRAMRSEVDLVVAVGDVVPLYFAWLLGAPFVFVGCAKSDHYLGGRFGSYGLLERWFVGHPRCRAIYARDSVTARNLSERGFRAFDLGNPMMDDLSPERGPLPVSARALAVGILPGSRDEAYGNWPLVLECLEEVARQAPSEQPVEGFAAIAESLHLDRLHAIASEQGWQRDETGHRLRSPSGVALRLCQGRFADWIHTVQIVIGMAGTANEQCVGLGLPVITVPGTGPQFNPAFAEAQTRLLGESVCMVTPDAQAVARALWEVWLDPARRERLRQNGLDRMGPPGAAQRITDHAVALL